MILFLGSSLPGFQGMGEVKSSPRHTNFLQASKKVPDSKVTTIESGDGADYYNAIVSQVEKHYNVKILSLDSVQLYKGSRKVDMPATIKVKPGTPQEQAQACVLRALGTKSDGNHSGDPATSFTGYLLCNGSEAPKL